MPALLRPATVSGVAAQARTVAVAVASNTLAVAPVFLVGGLATLLRADLGFDEAALGAGVAVFFAASAFASVPGGRLAERIGASRGMAAGAITGAAGLLGVAVVARDWTGLAAFLVLAGIGNGLIQPATNASLARGVVAGRQGLAFGIKQSSVPLAALAAGVAVPAVGLTVGWRWAFAGAATVAAVMAVVALRLPQIHPPVPAGGGTRRQPGIRSLMSLALAVGCGAAAVNSMGAFFVESAVAAGIAAGPAGLLLSLGGLTAVSVRVGVGWRADFRDGRHLPVVAGLMTGGVIGFGCLAAAGTSPVLLVVGTLLAFGAGWGWTGLMNFAIVRHATAAPAAATGITQTGVFIGATLGPLIFGGVVSRVSFAAAWLLAGATVAVAAVLVLASRRQLIRDLGLAPG